MPYTFLPDTSVVFNRKIIDFIVNGNLDEYKPVQKNRITKTDTLTIILSRVMLSEIENQANQMKSQDNVGLDVIHELHKLEMENRIDIKIVGERPKLDEIRLNPGGELDALIRKDAYDSKSILITADEVQSSIALVEGIDVLFTVNIPERKDESHELALLDIRDYFDDTTMSVHLRGHCLPLAKKGTPGNWSLEKINDIEMAPSQINEIANKIIRQAKNDEKSFIERNESGVTVIQLQKFRIVICRPPFSNTHEITAVKPLVSLTLEDYKLSQKVYERLDIAEGILVAGKPGAGKSTFIGALALFYLEKKKLVKTLESVRDLNVPKEVSQYAPLAGSLEGTADILLLVRPDYTIFDEVRTASDFKIFGDMRLAGVGLVGVVHASKAVDAVQRFIRRVELGVIPNVIDTIIFIDQGQVAEVLSLEMTVKKPTGFADRDLSRPVIEIRDFQYNDLLYEIYAFGSDVIVAPVGKRKYRNKTPKKKKRSNFSSNFNALDLESDDLIQTSVFRKNKGYTIVTDISYKNQYLNFYVKNTHLFSATMNNHGEIYIKNNSPIYSRIKNALQKGKKIQASQD
ncbi:ATPase [Promethearchaeum syntrophicum]|uniref:ATPase n=1 Tax=Promethearchaeum syntrophicum TaxID=2594042 RepID=A0A5B9DE23_9ARCH|nr:ATPase [Candidatus Prometheoarchaeum syntrophicum]QEE17127.1 putative KH and PIN-domain containing protein [Candidatus Prometheoarchaeum syntrophicum]